MSDKTLRIAQKVLEYFSSLETCVSGAISWALIYENQSFEQVDRKEGRACFGELGGHTQTGSKYFIFWCFYRKFFPDWPALGNKKRKNLTQLEKEYIRYIVRDSIFAPCFHTKNVEKIFKNGCIMYTHMPSQFVYSAASSIRYVTEFPNIIEMWGHFRKYIRDDEAFILSHLFTPLEKNSKVSKYISNIYWGSQHKWMTARDKFGMDEFKRFCNRDLRGLEGLPSFSQNCDFRNVTKIWKDNNLILKNKQFIWVNGVLKKSNGWSENEYREYDFANLKEDIKAILEANSV